MYSIQQLEELTIADIHAAMQAGKLTCEQLVRAYLARIAAYDKQGPSLNAIIMVNPKAVETAVSLDTHFASSSFIGPLHGIPIIIKDNYDTHDMPTTAGSLSLKGSIPPDDAYQVRKLREAGAVIIAKANMAEFAWSPFQTVGSLLPGHTLNPYALNRTPAGSSGGTATAVSANFGAVGLGTDTGNSIRGPSAHTGLVGFRSTMGLTSRDGIVPLFLNRDIGGPMARTVADAVAVLDVIAGHDPADPVTSTSQKHRAADYRQFLDKAGLVGARIGVVRQLSDTETADSGVATCFNQALDDMRQQGATIVDPLIIPNLDKLLTPTLFVNSFERDFNDYLVSLGDKAPFASLAELVEAGQFHPFINERMHYSVNKPATEEDYRQSKIATQQLRDATLAAMDAAQVDALVYPTWNNPPRLIGDMNRPDGNNSWQLSPPTGFPAITVPMGHVDNGLPCGLQFLGRAWSEPTLIKLVYAYEQATHHRRPPTTVPPLKGKNDSAT
ncbi:MAG: amidase family protein [Chloroflexota bacterium]